MAKIKCTGNIIHNGERYNIGDEVDTVKAKMDADSVKKLREAGALAMPAKPAPAPSGDK